MLIASLYQLLFKFMAISAVIKTHALEAATNSCKYPTLGPLVPTNTRNKIRNGVGSMITIFERICNFEKFHNT